MRTLQGGHKLYITLHTSLDACSSLAVICTLIASFASKWHVHHNTPQVYHKQATFSFDVISSSSFMSSKSITFQDLTLDMVSCDEQMLLFLPSLGVL